MPLNPLNTGAGRLGGLTLPEGRGRENPSDPGKLPVRSADSLELRPTVKLAVPARSPEDARKSAERIWVAGGGDAGYRRVERDPRHVNGGALDTNLDLVRRAKEQVALNGPLEGEALKGLSRTDRKAFMALTELTAGDPHARLALQLLLLEGDLTDAQRLSKDGETLLAALSRLGRQPLHSELERTGLVSDLIQELALPEAIAQHKKGTCTVTTLQILMAMKDPAEYVRIVAGLASEDGGVQLRSGDRISREPGTEQDDGSKRTASSRLWQASLMEYGNGRILRYENAKDKNTVLGIGGSGLNPGGGDRAFEGILGEEVETLGRRDLTPERLTARVERHANAGHPVSVGLKWGEKKNSGHKVLVTRVEPDRVYYSNPWGKEESMSRAEFTRRLKSAHFVSLDR